MARLEKRGKIGTLRQPGGSQRISDLIKQRLADIAEPLDIPGRKGWSNLQ
jgi:hypothetical protein